LLFWENAVEVSTLYATFFLQILGKYSIDMQ